MSKRHEKGTEIIVGVCNLIESLVTMVGVERCACLTSLRFAAPQTLNSLHSLSLLSNSLSFEILNQQAIKKADTRSAV